MRLGQKPHRLQETTMTMTTFLHFFFFFSPFLFLISIHSLFFYMQSVGFYINTKYTRKYINIYL